MPEQPKQSNDGRVYKGGGRRSVEEGGVAQCGAMRTTSNTGARCNKDALPDTDPPRCETHLGEYDAKDEFHMHRYYYRKLKPALAAAIAENLEGLSVVEQLDVSEELALIRHQAGNFVEEYAKACEPGVSASTRAEMGVLMAEQLERVLAAVNSMARVEEVKLKVSGVLASALQMVISAVVHAANDTFQNDVLVKEFEERLHERLKQFSVLRLADGSDGTTITPDMDVIEMDNLVPRAPEPVVEQ